jgi:hypothetical protein
MKDSDRIFLIDHHGKVEQVPHRRYEREDLLQKLVDEHPEIIVGEQIDPDNPPRWIVVRREAGIPDSENGCDRWAVDHLLLDQFGRPTFVEVKRSSDTRIRREVVGQMLEYAANAQTYWPREKIKALAAENFGSVEELDTRLIEFLQSENSPDTMTNLEAYWDTVDHNLRNGEVRLLFVADEIPTELRRVIEFLNEHMPLVEVLGVEVRQYESQDIRALVPRVVGQTEYARQQNKTPARSVIPTTEKKFLESCPEDARLFFNQLLSEADKRGFTIYWGQKCFSLRTPMPDGHLETYFYCYPPGVNSSPVPLFQAYLGSAVEKASHDALKNAFTVLIPVVHKGKHTLELALDQDGIQKAKAAMMDLLDVAKRASKGEIK